MADDFPLPAPEFRARILGLFGQHRVSAPVDMALVRRIVELVGRQAAATNGTTSGSNITAAHIVGNHFRAFANAAPEWQSGPRVTRKLGSYKIPAIVVDALGSVRRQPCGRCSSGKSRPFSRCVVLVGSDPACCSNCMWNESPKLCSVRHEGADDNDNNDNNNEVAAAAEPPSAPSPWPFAHNNSNNSNNAAVAAAPPTPRRRRNADLGELLASPGNRSRSVTRFFRRQRAARSARPRCFRSRGPAARPKLWPHGQDDLRPRRRQARPRRVRFR